MLCVREEFETEGRDFGFLGHMFTPAWSQDVTTNHEFETPQTLYCAIVQRVARPPPHAFRFLLRKETGP